MMSREREFSHSLAALLAAHEISEVVVSPGSRNAPLLEAVCSNPKLHVSVVVDERSAAFVALGKASVLRKCVALVCTSGTAPLNYAPALAEASYRQIPLLVITADRPHEWINRNDSQTIEQPHAYGSYIKRCFNIDARDRRYYCNLVANDAINAAVRFPQGPVQLNIELSDPSVDAETVDTPDVSAIRLIDPSMELSRETMKEIAERLACPTRVMVIAGSFGPNERLYRSLSRLCSWGNFVVLADAISNLPPRQGIITNVESVMTGIDAATLDRLKPDIVISYGGAILSKSLKKYLRATGIEHWHIGLTPCAQDTYCSISMRIETLPEVFFRQLVASMRRNDATSNYFLLWDHIAKEVNAGIKSFIGNAQWSDMSAVNRILNLTPSTYNIQLSNGMTVRNAQILPHRFHRIDCNRGVSGIEGSTSTAIGASTVYQGNTLLITGDMSAIYDLNALTLSCKSPRFKMVVIANGGGGIFKCIDSTRHYPQVDRLMVADESMCDIAGFARAAGFRVEIAVDAKELERKFSVIIAENERPAMLVVYTSAEESAIVMNQFQNRNKISLSL